MESDPIEPPHHGHHVLGRNPTHGILDTLGKAIVTGRYETRAFPTEAEIAKAYGVSRSVTRKVIARRWSARKVIVR